MGIWAFFFFFTERAGRGWGEDSLAAPKGTTQIFALYSFFMFWRYIIEKTAVFHCLPCNHPMITRAHFIVPKGEK